MWALHSSSLWRVWRTSSSLARPAGRPGTNGRSPMRDTRCGRRSFSSGQLVFKPGLRVIPIVLHGATGHAEVVRDIRLSHRRVDAHLDDSGLARVELRKLLDDLGQLKGPVGI